MKVNMLLSFLEGVLKYPWLTTNQWIEHRFLSRQARESTQGAEKVCSPIGGTIICTNQYPQISQGLSHQPRIHMEGPTVSATYVKEDSLFRHQ